ncbi:MAG: hypothetical protein M0Z52_13145 [Actinomycetota bacterium]|nr:hypothetical protein [Actinomycetota bacterium]
MKRYRKPPVKTILAALSLVFLIALAGSAFATPPAGTTIGNQASATYTDGSGISRTATSNTVQTVVQQVAAFTLTTTPQSKNGAPGNTVYFPHTLTNTGNGTDTFTLANSINGGNSMTPIIAIYPSTACNGVPDTGAPAITSTPSLASGAAFCFVEAVTVPGSAVAGNTATVAVTGTSQFNNTVTANNQDTTTVTGNAVISVTKSLSLNSGAPGTGPVTVTLTYTNTGINTATNVNITDLIGSGATAGMTYVASSAKWNGTALNDSNSGEPAGISYYGYNQPGNSNIANAVIASVGPNVTGTITFQVNINSGLAPGTSQTSNTACYAYYDGAAQQPASGCTGTNTAAFTVTQTAGVVANGSNSVSTNGTGEPVTAPSASQGATVSFNDYVWNTGNGSDSFNITLGSSSFPAGTTFALFKSDGVTPLTDTNGDGIPDTGPEAAGTNYKVVVKATLPTGVSGGGPYSVTLTATSVFNNTVSDTVIDTLTTITADTVDLSTNTFAGADSTSNAQGGPVATQSGNPGAALVFPMIVNDTSPTGTNDAYNILVSQSDPGNGTQISSNNLPAGWSVTFKPDTSVAHDCSSVGATETNTGTISGNGGIFVAGAANEYICAIVTTSASSSAGNTQLYFQVASPTTGAYDKLHEQATINVVRSLTITPNSSNQIYPGGTVTYTFTLTNNGDVTEGDGIGSTIALTNADSLSGWTSTMYYGATVVTSGEALNAVPGLSGGLVNGASITLTLKVFAPASANVNDQNISTITATTANNGYSTPVPAAASATGTTTVIAGQVRLQKYQALDATCSATCSSGGGCALTWTQSQITTGAVPGACIRYEIVATNEGTAAATNLVISDSTPANTALNCGSGNSAPVWSTTNGTLPPNTANFTAPACGGTGTISDTISSLAPGASETFYFGVQINP